jgi:hypothetical protein
MVFLRNLLTAFVNLFGYGTAGQVLTSGGAGVVPSWQNASASFSPTINQTVLSGPIDNNGLPNFGGSTGSAIVTAAGTLIATAANGVSNRTGSVVNPSWTGLSTNGTMYLGLTVNSDGSCTPFVTTLQPVYQWGGAFSTTNGQRTFNIQQMQMQVGNGATASQSYDVFVGEVTVAGNVVTAITWYALMGRYLSAFTNTLPGTSVRTNFNHNIGCNMVRRPTLIVECLTAEFGFAVGERVTDLNTQTGGGPFYAVAASWDYKTCGFSTANTNAFGTQSKSSPGTGVILTAANWKYAMAVERSW